MIILAILLTIFIFWSIWSLLMEIFDYETNNDKINIAMAITNWFNISVVGLILFIIFIRVMYLILICL